MLPLINKRWARALRGTSQAWRVVTLGGSSDHDSEDLLPGRSASPAVNAAAALAWFSARPR